jgi:hypothetical protein
LERASPPKGDCRCIPRTESPHCAQVKHLALAVPYTPTQPSSARPLLDLPACTADDTLLAAVMFSTAMLTTTLLALLSASFASAQLLAQGLPTCAQSCTLLNQAATACSGLQSANQGTWACFCQSGYLKSLYSSPSGICDAFCMDPSQNQQVMTWYQTNCGTDNGASEHADSGSGGQTTLVITSTSTSAASTAPATATRGAAATASSGSNSQTANRKQPEGGSWWDNHWVRESIHSGKVCC